MRLVGPSRLPDQSGDFKWRILRRRLGRHLAARVFRAFASCLGIKDSNAILEYLREHLDLSVVPGENRPPALVVHGGLEDLADESESQWAADAIGGTLFVIEDAFHTATNAITLSPRFSVTGCRSPGGPQRRTENGLCP